MILVFAAGLAMFILGVGTDGIEGWVLALTGAVMMGYSLAALTSGGRR